MSCHSEEGPTSAMYLIKLLLWVINYVKVEFSTNNEFFVFANLGNIFGETWKKY